MRYNLTDLLAGTGQNEEIRIAYEKSELILGKNAYRITDQKDISLGLFHVGKGSVRITLGGRINVEATCDRCLKPVEVELSLDREEEITEKDITDPKPGDQISFLDGYELDTDVLVEDTCISEMPPKVLCKEDCKGLCLVCGADLNEGDCGCDRFVPDPRMAMFGEVFAAANTGKKEN